MVGVLEDKQYGKMYNVILILVVVFKNLFLVMQLRILCVVYQTFRFCLMLLYISICTVDISRL